jgi:hypothetical protein
MFTVAKQFVELDGTLYWVKRQIKEENINPDLIHEYKEYLGADTVLKKNGHLFYAVKVDEAQLVEEDEVKLDQTDEI